MLLHAPAESAPNRGVERLLHAWEEVGLLRRHVVPDHFLEYSEVNVEARVPELELTAIESELDEVVLGHCFGSGMVADDPFARGIEDLPLDRGVRDERVEELPEYALPLVPAGVPYPRKKLLDPPVMTSQKSDGVHVSSLLDDDA
jgi:hypothetical protein